MGDQKIIINISEKEHEEIVKVAKEERRTLSSLGLKAISDYIKKLKENQKHAAN